MAVAYFIWPGDGWELLCYVYVVPAMVVNGWEWLEEPEFMEKIFGKGKESAIIKTPKEQGQADTMGHEEEELFE